MKNLTKYIFIAVLIAFFVSSNKVSAAIDSGKDLMACPFSSQANRTVVDFSTSLRSDQGASVAIFNYSTNLPAGSYTVRLFSYDGYPARTGISQPNERYYIEVKNGSQTLYTSPSTNDLQDNVRSSSNQISGSMNLSSSASTIVVKHSVYPDSSSPNSVIAGCAAFDFSPSTPVPTPINGSCGSSINSCSSGTLQDVADSGTQNLWNCAGSNGGLNASCNIAKAVVAPPPSVCTSCNCGYTNSCSGWDSRNNNVYGPNQPYQYTYYQNQSGWDSYNNYNYNNYSSLNGSCSAGVTNTSVGGLVTWTASATGGNGLYTYYWTGDEGLSSNGQTAPKTYNTGGTKTANLTITSNGQSITRTCTMNVNQVLAYTQTNPYVSSVYLSEVPYTGAGDTIKVILFTLALILWSTLIAYFLLKKRETQIIPVAVASENVISTEVHADTRAMSQIEDYARMNNIIISQGAVINLLKAKRLNDINVSETIRNIASEKTNSEGEWVTIGESDLEKYL